MAGKPDPTRLSRTLKYVPLTQPKSLTPHPYEKT
jgi:hypothetical protein